MSLELRVTNVHVNDDHVPALDFEILLRINAEFVLRAHGVDVFREGEFPFIEFASQLAAWLRAGGVENFDYESMDSDVVGFVYFHRRDDGRWDAGSMLPGYEAAIVTNDDVRQATKAFLAAVPALVEVFGRDVLRFVESEIA
ncbi:MAG: hypothetical protein WCJ30_23205 [Deltaproteobacteria bacterium]